MLSGYSDPPKASVRPIPRGFTCKGIDPCFVMDNPASKHEVKDITGALEKDLELYAEEHNDGEPIRVLIMDDNLTGATRVSFLENKLGEMSCVEFCETLSYVRHPAFLSMSTIREFPEGISYFTMPWHTPHDKKDLDVGGDEPDLVKLKFRVKVDNNFKLMEFKAKLGEYNYVFNREFIINGASIFYIKEINIDNSPKFVELNYVTNKFYPPKKCLGSQNSDSNDEADNYLSFCSFGIEEKTIGLCLACSCLNCNKRLLDRVLDITKNRTISIVAEFKKNGDENLVRAFEEWFAKKMPKIKLTIISINLSHV